MLNLLGWALLSPPLAQASEPPHPSAAQAAPARRGRRPAPGATRTFAPHGPLPSPADPCRAWERTGLFHWTPPGGDATRALVAVPAGPGPHRLVVLLHGGDGAPEDILGQTDILRHVDPWNAVVVAPSGAGGADPKKSNWNARDEQGMVRDDVRYLDQLVEALAERTCSAGVVVYGFSNGAMMANRWLCQGRQPDAAVTAAGRIGVDEKTCREPRPHRNYVGTEDDQFTTGSPTTADTLDLWGRVNQCDGPPTIDRAGSVTARVWTGCEAPTSQLILQGFPHAWPNPGAKGDAPIDATTEGWDWFLDVVPRP
jgi:poly(3-hydroxybutyrate) depolymerase